MRACLQRRGEPRVGDRLSIYHVAYPQGFSFCDEDKLARIPLLIFANKQDLLGALTSEQIAEVLELGSEIFAKRHWEIHPCSAVTGEGLVDGVDWIVQDIASRIFLMD